MSDPIDGKEVCGTRLDVNVSADTPRWVGGVRRITTLGQMRLPLNRCILIWEMVGFVGKRQLEARCHQFVSAISLLSESESESSSSSASAAACWGWRLRRVLRVDCII